MLFFDCVPTNGCVSAYFRSDNFSDFHPQFSHVALRSVCARKGTTMPWAPRSSRQFDFGYFSQESQHTASAQNRSAYSGQTVQGSNVFMDHQSFLQYQNDEAQVEHGTGNVLPPIGMFPQAPILTGDHPYPRCLLACMLCCVFGSFVSLIFEPLLQYIPVCLTDSPPPASVTYPSVS